jgi:signal transduction histidine kinase
MLAAAPPRPKHRALVFAPFLLIAVLFAATDLLAMHRVSAIRNETKALVSNIVTSIKLVTRMRHDFHQVTVLAQKHILATEPASMSALEDQIEAARADYQTAASLYEPLATLPGEAARWHELQGQIARLKPTLEAVLALSRRNEDGAALHAFEALDQQLGVVLGEFRSLIDLNYAGADAAVARADGLQRSSAGLLELLALSGILLAGAVGVATTRLVQRREELQLRHAQLLEATNRELDAYAGRVAHDLRGPLATVALAAKRLSQFAPQMDKTTELVNRSLARMEALIDDLLALSRMQIGAQVSACDPAGAASQVREELAPRAESSDASLAVDVQAAEVRCSEGLLRQVIWNMVDNAMKYRRPEVHLQVDVRGRSVDHRYELSVSDNGVGMTPDEVSRVFEPFYRAVRHQGEPGTGLGLSIVKRVLEACGGDVSVRSAPGRGSTFLVRLPLA